MSGFVSVGFRVRGFGLPVCESGSLPTESALYQHIFLCACVRVFVCLWVGARAHARVCVCVCACVCVCVCVCVCLMKIFLMSQLEQDNKTLRQQLAAAREHSDKVEAENARLTRELHAAFAQARGVRRGEAVGEEEAAAAAAEEEEEEEEEEDDDDDDEAEEEELVECASEEEEELGDDSGVREVAMR